MNSFSSTPRLQSAASENLLEHKIPIENRITLNLRNGTLATLATLKTTLENHPNPLNWGHLINVDITENFSLEELMLQFNLLEEILENKLKEEERTYNFFSKGRDQLKIAIEFYKLAIMEAALNNLCHEEEIIADKKKSRLKHVLYYALLLGGSWVAYLHGYDAAQAIGSLLPYGIPATLMWGAGSLMFLVALGLFSSFEATELKKHMGFATAKNLKTTLEINQKQFEITHKFAKHLVIHSEQKHIESADNYRAYTKLLHTFDKSINKTKNQVESFKEGWTPKVAKNMLLMFGMVFTAADEIFLAIGFGALALSGPWGWVVIAGTALIGAALFYVAFHDMVRDKVAPTLKQKEEILEKHAEYAKDNLCEAVNERLAIKEQVFELKKQVSDLEKQAHVLQNAFNLTYVSKQHINAHKNDINKIKNQLLKLETGSMGEVKDIQTNLLKLTQQLKCITHKYEKENIQLRRKLTDTQLALKRAEETVQYQGILLENKNEQIAIMQASQNEVATSPSFLKKSSTLSQLSYFQSPKSSRVSPTKIVSEIGLKAHGY